MKVLFIADIIGQSGREAVARILPELKLKEQVDLVIANGENAAHGMGLTPSIARDLFHLGVDVLTMGNHTWDKKEILDIIDDEPIVRPANYAPGVPGRGAILASTATGVKVGILNLIGRVFMPPNDCPFRAADKVIAELKKETPVIIVDIHAEATSEKVAMGWYLDGKVSAVIGTHTHVQTADDKILPGGTAYLTDVGMTGPFDSVIGIKKEIILQRFLMQMPIRFEVSDKDIWFNGALIEIDEKSGKAIQIQRLQIKV
ncbi:MAG: TIGR00282 family metallophosphoesterase [bacterium]|nr:TIGR00282 family metallophosphoesterase [bacterium]